MSRHGAQGCGAQGVRVLTRVALVCCAALGPLLWGHPIGLSGGGLAWADAERMRLEPGERERLRGELREQPWYRGHGRHPYSGLGGPVPTGDELSPRGPVDGPRFNPGPRGRRGDEIGPPAPWQGMRLSPDERRELRRQLRERPGESGDPWGGGRGGHGPP